MPGRFDSRYRRRLRPRRALDAFITTGQAEIVDISETGIAIRHPEPLPSGSATLVDFQWGVTRMSVRCRVVYCLPEPAGGYRSGLTLGRTSEASNAEYRRRVSEAVMRASASTASAFE
jgi:hypothetical protein